MLEVTLSTQDQLWLKLMNYDGRKSRYQDMLMTVLSIMSNDETSVKDKAIRLARYADRARLDCDEMLTLESFVVRYAKFANKTWIIEKERGV